MDLRTLNKSISEVAVNLRVKKKVFSFDELYKKAISLLPYSKEDENEYEDKLKLFQGNISQFRDAKNLFSRTFGLSR